MKIKKFKHEGVNEDGTCESGGAVQTKGGMDLIKGNCGLKGCDCSDGYFLIITKPLKEGIVEGCSIEFENLEELETCGRFRKMDI